MPSGLNGDVVDRGLDRFLGVGADTTILGADPVFMDLLTTEASDDNGTDAVGWGQGRASVPVADATQWPDASGRAKPGAAVTMPANTSGALITAVAVAFYDDDTAGNYLGGGPVPGGTLDIPAGVAPVVTATLSSPPPS